MTPAAAARPKSEDPNAAAQGWSALHQVAWSRRPNRGFNMPGAVPTGTLDSLELVRRLVARGADVNARITKEPRDGNRNMLNRIGSTPFLMAAKTADVPLMRVLLESGADPKLKAADGTSAIMMAAICQNDMPSPTVRNWRNAGQEVAAKKSSTARLLDGRFLAKNAY